MGIIGGWRVKYLKARRKPRKKIHAEYARRNEALPCLGYATYREYLASPEWKQIKASLLGRSPNCLLCPRKASVVHHLSYDDRTMLGLDEAWLACLCDGCHESIEIDPAGAKRTLKQANEELLRLAVAAGRGAWAGRILRRMATQAQSLERDRQAERAGERRRKRKRKLTPQQRAERKAEKAKWKKA